MEAYDSYIAKLSKYGRLLMVLGLAGSFTPPLVLWLRFGIVPTGAMIVAMIPLLISANIVGSFIEPLTAFPMIGVTGSYAGWITGSVLNIKAPCALAAQSAAGVEPGTREGTVITNLSIPISTIVTLCFTLIGALLGSIILAVLPASVLASFSTLGPAIFGALLGNAAFKHPKTAAIIFVLAVILRVLGAKFWLIMPLGVVLGIVLNLTLYKKVFAEEQAEAAK